MSITKFVQKCRLLETYIFFQLKRKNRPKKYIFHYSRTVSESLLYETYKEEKRGHKMKVVFVAAGIILFLLYLLWLVLVTQKMPRVLVVVCDTVLVLMSLAIIFVGLCIRDAEITENRKMAEEQILKGIYTNSYEKMGDTGDERE